MKQLLFLLFTALTLASCGSGRLNTDASKHSEMLATSRKDNSSIVSMDTIFKAGTAVGILKTKGNMIQESHTIFTIAGDEIIDVVQSDPKQTKKTYHEYKILDRDALGSAFIEYSMSTMTVVDNIVDNDLLSPTGLNKKAAGRFLLRYPDPDIRPKAPEVNRMIDRNRTAEFQDRWEKKWIVQDGRTIATYTKETGDRDKDGDELEITTIKYMDGTVCATLVMKKFRPHTATLATSKDNKTITVEYGTEYKDLFVAALDHLIKNLYL